MKTKRKAIADPDKRASFGKHGGNRAGRRARKAANPRRSTQAAGKDPQRSSRR